MTKASSIVRSLTLVVALAGVASAAFAANGIKVPNGVVNPLNPCATGNPGNPNTARFSGSCGAQVTVTNGDTTAAYVQDNSPAAENTYNVRFYINDRGLETVDTSNVTTNNLTGDMDVFQAINAANDTTAGTPAFRVFIRPHTTLPKRIQVLIAANDNSSTEIVSVPTRLARGYREIEVHWSNSGSNNVQWWVDGVAQPSLTVTNSNLHVEYVRWGSLVVPGGSFGTINLDDFASQRTGNIDPVTPFGDVHTTDPFWTHALGVYAGEVMPDCGVGSFCPGTNITRGDMGAFVIKGRFGASYDPTCACPVSGCFTDVICGTTPNAEYIYEMVRQGIAAAGGTTTCAGTRPTFCPNDTINRAEMSAFLIAARPDLPQSNCNSGSPFTDVPANSSFCPYIATMVAQGITAGCGGGLYCVGNPVNKGNMAVFVHQAFSTVNAELKGPVNAP